MASSLPRLIHSPTDEVNYQETSFGVDAVARNVCNTWEEAMTNPAFDAVVIGSGMFGGYFSDKLFRDAKGKRTLLLEAGGVLVAGHYQDLPAIWFNGPEPMDPPSEKPRPKENVWGVPRRGKTHF